MPLQRSEPLTTMLAWNRQGPGRDGGAEHRSRLRTEPALYNSALRTDSLVEERTPMPFIGSGHLWLVLLELLVLGAIVYAVVAVVRRSGASMPPNHRECPACKERMRRDASICPHCRTPSEPWTPSAPPS
jgi:hypothetical protein